MSSPSISVMNCGTAFSFASHLRQSVLGLPIAREFLDRRELHALGLVGHCLTIGQPRRCDALAEINQRLVGNADAERTDRGVRPGSGGREGERGNCRRGRKHSAPRGRLPCVGHDRFPLQRNLVRSYARDDRWPLGSRCRPPHLGQGWFRGSCHRLVAWQLYKLCPAARLHDRTLIGMKMQWRVREGATPVSHGIAGRSVDKFVGRG